MALDYTEFGISEFFEMANVNVLRPEGDVGGPVLEREVQDAGARLGVRAARKAGRRLFMYDRSLGLAQAALQYSTTRSDRMSELLAASTLDKIHRAYHLINLNEEQYYDFDTALFVCYAINGASQLLPTDRVIFGVGVSEFDYRTVYNLLGVDSRRFYRAFANAVVDACRHLYYHYDPENDDHIYARDMMIQLADERNVSRAPWLIADCAEAATNLDQTEKAIVAVSKRTVIGNTPNAVDRRKIGVPFRSLDNYDSSTMQSVPNTTDIHRDEAYYS